MSPAAEARLNLLRDAPLDRWVALSGDESRIVAVGANYRDVVARSEEAGELDPVIVKTPPVWAPLSV